MDTFKRNLKIKQGSTFNDVVIYKAGDPAVPVDLTGCAARMQIRSDIDSPTVLLELTTTNGGIILGGVAGTITLRIEEPVTASLAWECAVYDLEIIFANGDVQRKMEGSVTVSPGVTRP